MLNFFPTPYPDEWWYSVLCRYHMLSGNPKTATTLDELFTGNQRQMIGTLFPNNSTYHIVTHNLPKGLFDMRDLILNHTLFSYYLRMLPLARKEKMLNDLCKGEGESVSWIWSSESKSDTKLKYCPVCRENDLKVYGETYWRAIHQLPLVSVCLEHGCKLKEVYIGRRNKLNEHFYVPSKYCLQEEPDYNILHFELPLAKTIYSYWKLPLDVGPTEGYSNISQALYNIGYMSILRQYNITLNRQKLYQDLVSFYGQDLTESVFGKESAAFILTRISNWTLVAPERYAMLSVMIGQTPDVTFGSRLSDAMRDQIIELTERKITMSKKYIAEQLGIKTHQVDAVCLKYGIDPFWAGQHEKKNDGSGSKKEYVKMYCREGEKKQIEAYAKKMNFANISDFIRSCIYQVINASEHNLSR